MPILDASLLALIDILLSGVKVTFVGVIMLMFTYSFPLSTLEPLQVLNQSPYSNLPLPLPNISNVVPST